VPTRSLHFPTTDSTVFVSRLYYLILFYLDPNAVLPQKEALPLLFDKNFFDVTTNVLVGHTCSIDYS
jgi:hypothetical protein